MNYPEIFCQMLLDGGCWLKTFGSICSWNDPLIHLHWQAFPKYSAHCWPAGGSVVSVVRFSLRGAYRCGCGWPRPLHHPQGLEGVVVQALLCEKALGGVQEQHVLNHKPHRWSPWALKTPRTCRPLKQTETVVLLWIIAIIIKVKLLPHLIVSHSHQTSQTMMWNAICDICFFLPK